ncbi:uncharacterized protein zgc:113279 [Hemiscyllium ocellatum]|uniref:uncharacterized protein zgc:113279 n=1 Tax=Hemiscyllium ocellatum TaxID=170820 RepID=UPI002966FE17|nr:uncharacterized protein zgc:113279 [Hemiscyllium ocellatum]
MLYKVLSPHSIHDHSSNDSDFDDYYRKSNRSPLAGKVATTEGDCSQPTPSSSRHLEHSKKIPEAAKEASTDSKNLMNTKCQKKYVGVRVRRPVRDLLRNYRIARGEDPNVDQVDVHFKSNNLRRRVVRETGHTMKWSSQMKKINMFPSKNFEELLEDLVEVLESDLKQNEARSYQTTQNIPEMDCQEDSYTSSPVSFWGSQYDNQKLQQNQGTLINGSTCSSEYDVTVPVLGSVFPTPYSHFELEGWNYLPRQSVAFTDQHCVNTSDKDRNFSCQPCYSQTVKKQSPPCSPSFGEEWFSQAELNNIHNYKSSHVESKCFPITSQQQHSLDGSALSFFQSQLRHVEGSLCNVSTQELLSVDESGNTMLHNAVIQGKRALTYSLACRMANIGTIDTKDTRGRTALHLAAERNQHLVVNDLILLGAQINERDHFGKTPIHLCAENGFLRVLHVIEKTMMNGIDVVIDASDNNHLTPLHYMVLAHAATVKAFENTDMSYDMMKFLMLRKEQLLDGMRCLLRMGSSLCTKDLICQTAINLAEEINDIEVLNFLYGHLDGMKNVCHKEFSPCGIFNAMDQKVSSQEVAPEELPCDIFLQTSMYSEELNKRLNHGCQ